MDYPHVYKSRWNRTCHMSQRTPTALTEEMLLIMLIFQLGCHCLHPFTVSVEHNAIKQRITLQATCQKKTIINTLKMISYNLPLDIKQDVTIVSNNIKLSVDFLTANTSLHVIEEYKTSIIKQLLSSLSKQGYKLYKHKDLFKKQQDYMLVHPMCLKQCLSLKKRHTAELQKDIQLLKL